MIVSLKLPILMKVIVSSQESEGSCICVLGTLTLTLFLRFVY